MKKIVYFLCIGFLLNSCGRRNEENAYYETINANVTITDYSVCKYTRVEGYIYYKGLKLFVNNGSNGYHYNHYNLDVNDVIERRITVCIDNYGSNGITISSMPVDFSDYESSN